jgi:hypothetical protein
MRPTITIVQPYYRNSSMLHLAITNRLRMPADVIKRVEWIVIDDGSPEPAFDEFEEFLGDHEFPNVRLLRVDKDIPWNQHGCRNLGAKEAKGIWLQMQDMDRLVLPGDQLSVLNKIDKHKMVVAHHYKARGINPKPHGDLLTDFKPIVNQFWCTQAAYWDVGGYDEDYVGCYGGDGPTLRALERLYPLKTMNDVIMFRYDRHIVPDSTTQALDRSGAEYQRRSREKARWGTRKPTNPIRFQWREIHLVSPSSDGSGKTGTPE